MRDAGDGAAAPAAGTVQTQDAPGVLAGANSARVDFLTDDDAMTVRVSVQPIVRTTGGWFWCIDAEPPLAILDRQCASNGTWGFDGYVTAERTVPVDPARAYYLKLYCERTCDWRVESPGARAIVTEN
jgi:hypothetical protein